MPHDQSDFRLGAFETPAGYQSSVLVTARGWRPEDFLERAARDLLLGCGPITEAGARGLPVYLGFPWSAFIDSLRNPAAVDAPLHSAWHRLRASVPWAAKAITVCTHPDLPDHLDRLAAAGVTDVFWTGTMPDAASLPQAPTLRLHPFPALHDPDALPVTGTGPGAAFSLCPEAGNRPGLWAAVAAGLLPVLSMTGPLLPGPAALWRSAAVVHDGSDAELATVPAQMAAIFADPARLSTMRQALKGIGLLYGHRGLVHDVLICLMQRVDPSVRAEAPAAGSRGRSFFARLTRRFSGKTSLSRPEAQLVLQQAACDLLTGNGGDLILTPGARSAAAWRLIGLARMALAEGNQALSHFDETLDVLRREKLLGSRIGAANAPFGFPAPLRVFLPDPGVQRSLLAHVQLRRHLDDRFSFVDSAEKADLVVAASNREMGDTATSLVAAGQTGKRPALVVLSQEPLRDNLATGDLSARNRLLDCGGGVTLPYLCLNPANSDIFRFETLPWAVLSDERAAARLALLMTPFARLSPRALLHHWQAAPLQAAFVAERCAASELAARHPRDGVLGLGVYRTRVAELTPGDRVLRIGQGWPGTDTRRDGRPDWHLDKLALLHGQVRLCSAYENTLHCSYVTEKPFDAFAIGAIPITVADAGHRLFDLIQPEAMLNTRFCAPDVAAARIASFVPDMTVAEAWLETAQGLLARLRNPARIRADYHRLADACHHELVRFAQTFNAASVA